jgi:hypothetical protein
MRHRPWAILLTVTLAAASAGQATAPATAPATTRAAAPPPALQLALRATREEWKVIGPLVDEVERARRVIDNAAVRDRVADPLAFFGNDSFVGPSPNARGSLGFVDGFSGWGTTAPATGGAPATGPVLQAATAPAAAAPDGAPATLAMAMADLQTAAADPATPESALRDKLALVRAARARAQVRLAAANEALRRALTPDQEGFLVALGVLD